MHTHTRLYGGREQDWAALYLNVCHFWRQNEAFVVAMDHRQDSQRPGGDAPGVLVDVALLVGLRVIVNLDNEGG